MKYTHDIIATVGEYTNKAGEKKKRYHKCGAAFTDDDGRISLKLDGIPVSPDWSGWLSLYEPRDSHSDSREQRRDAGTSRQYDDSGNSGNAIRSEDRGEIPF